jgi:hypothetical protein
LSDNRQTAACQNQHPAHWRPVHEHFPHLISQPAIAVRTVLPILQDSCTPYLFRHSCQAQCLLALGMEQGCKRQSSSLWQGGGRGWGLLTAARQPGPAGFQSA